MDWLLGAGLAFALLPVGCDSATGSSPPCMAMDLNGTSGGTHVVVLTVSDTAFSVGGADSGSTEPNITVENGATVHLTMTNIGTTAHDFIVQCQPTPNSAGCPMQSCFPEQANIPPVPPDASVTTTFITPFKEGPYLFTSDVDGDTQSSPEGGWTGLVGEFVLL